MFSNLSIPLPGGEGYVDNLFSNTDFKDDTLDACCWGGGLGALLGDINEVSSLGTGSCKGLDLC